MANLVKTSSGTGHPVPELDAPNWHGADLGMWVFQFQNWTTSAGTGTVPKWGPTYTLLIEGNIYFIKIHANKTLVITQPLAV
jgi:hypothetical protein